jgi:hypothetical protein
LQSRADLADRAVFLTLDRIPGERHKAEAELWADFEKERPAILALLDAVSCGLRMVPVGKAARKRVAGEIEKEHVLRASASFYKRVGGLRRCNAGARRAE